MLHKKGFTLLEILLVVGIIAILAGIVIIAINPSRQLATTRNTERASDLKQVYNAMTQYYIDHSSYPASSTFSSLTEICNTGTASATTTSVTGASCGSLANLSALVPTYLVAIPVDPGATSTLGFLDRIIPTAYAASLGTGYKIMVDANNKVALSAPIAELGQVITVGPVVVVSAPQIPTNGLVSTWLFDGNANDSVGGNNGTVVGATSTTGLKGLANTAYSFNGTSNYISVSPITNMGGVNDYSVSLWLKTSQTGTGMFFTNEDVTGEHEIKMAVNYVNANKLTFSTYEGGSLNVLGNTVVNDNSWHHIIYVKNGTTGYIYLDGALDNSGTVKNVNGTLSYTTFGALKYGGGTGYYINGSIDLAHVYNRALSSGEVSSIYNIEKP